MMCNLKLWDTPSEGCAGPDSADAMVSAGGDTNDCSRVNKDSTGLNFTHARTPKFGSEHE